MSNIEPAASPEKAKQDGREVGRDQEPKQERTSATGAIADWVADNMAKPFVNELAIEPYNATAGKFLGKTETYKVTEAAFLSPTWFAQNVSSTLGSMVPYMVAGRFAKGVLSAPAHVIETVGEGVTAAGSRGAAVMTAQVLRSNHTGMIAGGGLYGALRDPVVDGDTRSGNAAGAMVGFSFFEAGNALTQRMGILRGMPLRALTGGIGGASQYVTSRYVSHGDTGSSEDVIKAGVSGGIMNVALPAGQKALTKGSAVGYKLAQVEYESLHYAATSLAPKLEKWLPTPKLALPILAVHFYMPGAENAEGMWHNGIEQMTQFDATASRTRAREALAAAHLQAEINPDKPFEVLPAPTMEQVGQARMEFAHAALGFGGPPQVRWGNFHLAERVQETALAKLDRLKAMPEKIAPAKTSADDKLSLEEANMVRAAAQVSQTAATDFAQLYARRGPVTEIQAELIGRIEGNELLTGQDLHGIRTSAQRVLESKAWLQQYQNEAGNSTKIRVKDHVNDTEALGTVYLSMLSPAEGMQAAALLAARGERSSYIGTKLRESIEGGEGKTFSMRDHREGHGQWAAAVRDLTTTRADQFLTARSIFADRSIENRWLHGEGISRLEARALWALGLVEPKLGNQIAERLARRSPEAAWMAKAMLETPHAEGNVPPAQKSVESSFLLGLGGAARSVSEANKQVAGTGDGATAADITAHRMLSRYAGLPFQDTFAKQLIERGPIGRYVASHVALLSETEPRAGAKLIEDAHDYKKALDFAEDARKNGLPASSGDRLVSDTEAKYVKLLRGDPEFDWEALAKQFGTQRGPVAELMVRSAATGSDVWVGSAARFEKVLSVIEKLKQDQAQGKTRPDRVENHEAEAVQFLARQGEVFSEQSRQLHSLLAARGPISRFTSAMLEIDPRDNDVVAHATQARIYFDAMLRSKERNMLGQGHEKALAAAEFDLPIEQVRAVADMSVRLGDPFTFEQRYNRPTRTVENFEVLKQMALDARFSALPDHALKPTFDHLLRTPIAIPKSASTEQIAAAAEAWRLNPGILFHWAKEIGARPIGERIFAAAAWNRAMKDPAIYQSSADIGKNLQTAERMNEGVQPRVLIPELVSQRAIEPIIDWLYPNVKERQALLTAFEKEYSPLKERLEALSSLKTAHFDEAYTALKQSDIGHLAPEVVALRLSSTFGGSWRKWLDEQAKLGRSMHDATYWLPLRPTAATAGLPEFLFKNQAKQTRSLEIVARNWHKLKPDERGLLFDEVFEKAASVQYGAIKSPTFAKEAASWSFPAEEYAAAEQRFLDAQNVPMPFPVDKAWSAGALTGRFLPRSDARGLFLGQHTNCCQHPHGAGSTSAWNGLESPRAGFFVVEDKGGNVVAQSWAWISDRGALVFDNVEAKGLKARETAVRDIYRNAAADLSTEFPLVTVGRTGDLPLEGLQNAGGKTQPLPNGYDGYTDASDQSVLHYNPRARWRHQLNH